MERRASACPEKKAVAEGYVIGYVDEAAFSHCPYVQRTYHPKGQRPVLKHGPVRGGVQVISMVTPSGKLYFKVKEDSFKGEDIVDFLNQLLYHFRSKKLLIIWDGATTHRSKEVKEFLRTKAQGRIHLEILPSHSPQLNVDEQTHGYIKQHRLPNCIIETKKKLVQKVEEAYEWLKKQKWLIYNFFFHKETGFYR